MRWKLTTCVQEMNEWLSVHGIGKRVPAVSGGTIFLGSSRGGETNKKAM
jgi:hypothetical protein